MKFDLTLSEFLECSISYWYNTVIQTTIEGPEQTSISTNKRLTQTV